VTIIRLDEQPILEMLSDRKSAVVHMIEDSELCASFLPVPFVSAHSAFHQPAGLHVLAT
jgi:hypothetical protein